MRIVHFGTYSMKEEYPRNLVITKSLQAVGVDVIPCHQETWGNTAERVRGVTNIYETLKNFFRIIKAWAILTRKYLFHTPDHDLVLVGYPGYLDIFLARLLATIRSKPVVLDAFLSLYEAVVEDRKLLPPHSLKARGLKLLDQLSSRVAHAVFLDTNAHIHYYKEVLQVKTNRFIRVFVGAPEEYFNYQGHASRQAHGQILFFGSFLPLHGIDVIIKAAAKLKQDKSLSFSMVGNGPEWEKCVMLAKNFETEIKWEPDWIPYRNLSERIAESEICLGIFSKETKAQRVIPCKVFNILAMGKPLITANTPASQEAFIHGENAYLIPPGDPDALAEAVTILHNNPTLRETLALGGLNLYRNRFSCRALGKTMVEDLKRFFSTLK
jgi:glycosyltransferase involved in cell wall biosynthesis